MTTIITMYSLVAIGTGYINLQGQKKPRRRLWLRARGYFCGRFESDCDARSCRAYSRSAYTSKISSLIGAEAGFTAPDCSGDRSLTLIPSLVAFPLAGSLLRASATVMTISAFITTLVMVGVVTAPMEMKILGRRSPDEKRLRVHICPAYCSCYGGDSMSGSLRKLLVPAAMVLVYIGLFIWLPTAQQSSRVVWDYHRDGPGFCRLFFSLMGLMDVWLPKDKIQKWLGNGSGMG